MSIEDCAKDGGEEFFTEMHCVRIINLKDSIGIRLKNAIHLGKKFLAAIFSAIVYYNNYCHYLTKSVLVCVANISTQTQVKNFVCQNRSCHTDVTSNFMEMVHLKILPIRSRILDQI